MNTSRSFFQPKNRLVKALLFLLTSLYFFLAVHFPAQGQQLLAINSKWNNKLNEWEIATSEDEYAGEIRMQWTLQNDWTDWSIQLGNQTGRLKTKWQDNPNEWELRMGGKIITLRTAWRGKFDEWNIISDQGRHTIKTTYGNSLESWETLNRTDNYLGLYTTWEGDPRKWTVVDDMKEEVSIYTKVAMAFIAILHSIPK